MLFTGSSPPSRFKLDHDSSSGLMDFNRPTQHNHSFNGASLSVNLSRSYNLDVQTKRIYPYRRIGVGQYKNPLFTISLPKRKQQKSKSPKKDRSKQPYLKMGKAALSKVHFDHFSLTGDLGLPNPMHTGLMYGWIQSIGNLIKIDRLNVGIVPLFNNRFETDLDGQFHLKIVPVKVIWQAVKTYFKFKA